MLRISLVLLMSTCRNHHHAWERMMCRRPSSTFQVSYIQLKFQPVCNPLFWIFIPLSLLHVCFWLASSLSYPLSWTCFLLLLLSCTFVTLRFMLTKAFKDEKLRLVGCGWNLMKREVRRQRQDVRGEEVRIWKKRVRHEEMPAGRSQDCPAGTQQCWFLSSRKTC